MATKTKKRPKKTVENKLKEAKNHISDVSEEIEWLKACFYGRNGKGKTYLGATGPKPIIIDCNEQGTPSIRKVKDAKKFKVDVWSDIDLAYWYLKSGNHDRETVVIDTTTALAALCMKFVLGDEASRDPTRDPDMPTKREWGKVGELMSTQIIQFRNLPMHVIFLAQERRSFQEDEDDEAEVGPSLSNKPKEALTACVNVIGRIYTKGVIEKKKVKGKVKSIETVEHRLLLGHHDLYITKVNIQDHGLPKILRNPTIPKILERINKGEG